MSETAVENAAPVRIDPVKAYKLRFLNKLSYSEIAEQLGVSVSGVHQAVQKLVDIVHSPEEHQDFDSAKAILLGTLEHRLLASLADEDAIAKASLNNRAYAFEKISQARRLEEGKSTQNVGIISKLVQNADDKLFGKSNT